MFGSPSCRNRRSVVFRRFLRFPTGASAPAPPGPTPFPTADFELVSDDVIVDGSNAVTSWPAVHGPTLGAVAGGLHNAYSTGPQANGHIGVMGTVAGSRLESTADVIVGTANKFTYIAVFDPDDQVGLGNRRYLGPYYYNVTSSSATHWVRTAIANVAGWNRIGHYIGELLGSGWQSTAGTQSLRGLQWMGITYDGAIGETVLYQNGSVIATFSTAPIVGMPVKAPVVLASYELTDAPINQQYTGSLYYIYDKFGFVATPTQMADKFATDQTTYDIQTAPFFPNAVTSNAGWYNESGKSAAGGAFYVGTLGQQVNQATGAANLMAYSGGVVDGGPTGRPNGIQYWVHDGTTGFGTNGAMGDMVSASAYYRAHVVKVRSCATSGGAAYALANIWCDISGYKWEGINNNGGTDYSLKCGHWGGAEYNATIPNLAYNTWYLVEHWYDGTNIGARATDASGTIVNATNTAAPNITGSGLVQPFVMGRGTGAHYASINLAMTYSVKAYPSGTDRTNLYNYFMTRYMVP